MGKVLVIGESHLDLVAEIVCLDLLARNEESYNLTAIAVELPETLVTLENSIKHLEQSIQDYSTFFSQLSIQRDALHNEDALTKIEFLTQQIKQQQIKLLMLKEIKNHKVNYYSIDKRSPTVSAPDSETVSSIMTDPERDDIMANNLAKIARNNDGITIAIVGLAHLEKLSQKLKNSLTEEEFKQFFFLHCFSNFSYQEENRAKLLMSAPPFTTSWKDNNDIYHIDARDKTRKLLTQSILSLVDGQSMVDFSSPKKLRIPQESFYFSTPAHLSKLFQVLSKTPDYSFTPEFYDNYLFEDYYKAISEEYDEESVEDKLQQFINKIDSAHPAADPKLNHLLRAVALKQLHNLNPESGDLEQLRNSLNYLEKLLEKAPNFRISENFADINKIAKSMLSIIVNCKNNKEDLKTGLEKINNLIENYQNIISKIVVELNQVSPEASLQLNKESKKLTHFQRILPLLMNNIPDINLLNLNLTLTLLNPVENHFSSEQAKKDYFESIRYFCRAMIKIHKLPSEMSSENEHEFIIYNLKKAGELGFSLAHVELGDYYKQQGDFINAFGNYIDAAINNASIAYGRLTTLLAENKKPAPLDYFMLSILSVLVEKGKKVHNNFDIDSKQHDFLETRMEEINNRLLRQLSRSIFNTAFITTKSEKLNSSFSLLSILSNQSLSRNPLNVDIDVQIKGLEAGLSLLLGKEAWELLGYQNNQSNIQLLLKEYVAIAQLWFNILNKFQTPDEQLLALSVGLTDYLSESTLPYNNTLRQTLGLVIEQIDRMILGERIAAVTKEIDAIKTGQSLVSIDDIQPPKTLIQP
ncbi:MULTISPECIES: hypothetical protein [unclassified Legionella]|uniref:hypothetical protein n=1 Tax=unclassified Legionella TaxID=2622702 RepID=UPI0010548B0A|nr:MULTISPECIES: hypothetical protein [unclassified Legionella]MDI9818598.1 hypothetical protein [Legionella sp. PL877]